MGFPDSSQGQRPWSRPRSSYHIIYLTMLLLSSISSALAYDMEASQYGRDSILFKRLERRGEIFVDRRAPPSYDGFGLVKKDSTSSDSSSVSTTSLTKSVRTSSASTAQPTITASASTASNGTTATTATTSSTSSTTTESTLTALPTPFDTSLGSNFTLQACPAFFNTFINNATFKTCLPVSLLLQNSMGFFKAIRSASSLQTVLDAACMAPLAVCSPLMASIADQLIDDANCGQDYRKQNPLVMQAYSGLLAYEPLYNATCLKNTTTSNYCFTEAVVNTTNAADLYPYYTALGISLPSAAQPTCSTCLQRTMSVFAGYAGQKDQPLSKTYVACALQVDGVCGPQFATADVKTVSTSSKNAAVRSTSSAMAFGAAALAASLLILV